MYVLRMALSLRLFIYACRNHDKRHKIHIGLHVYMISDKKVSCMNVMGACFSAVWFNEFMPGKLIIENLLVGYMYVVMFSRWLACIPVSDEQVFMCALAYLRV